MSSINDLHKEIGDLDELGRQFEIGSGNGLGLVGATYRAWRPSGKIQ